MSLFEDPTIARVTALILKALEKGPASTAQLHRAIVTELDIVPAFYPGATTAVGAPARFLVLPGVEFLQVAKPLCARARQQHTVGPIR